MKVIQQTLMELKIASRGFYLYVELAASLIVLFALLFFVPEQSVSQETEYLYYSMPLKNRQILINQMTTFNMVKVSSQVIHLKPSKLKIFPDADGQPSNLPSTSSAPHQHTVEIVKKTDHYQLSYPHTKELSALRYDLFDKQTGHLNKKLIVFENYSDMLRATAQSQYIGAVISFDDNGQEHYEYYYQGNENNRLIELSYLLHNEKLSHLKKTFDATPIDYVGIPEQLNHRQNYLPLLVVYMNGLLGVLIASAYFFEDKQGGILRAFYVSPLRMPEYLLSKILSLIPVSLITSLIITLPIMKRQPNYLLFLLLMITIAILAANLGLFISAFFKDIKTSFGGILIILILMMLPTLSYHLPAFSPSWLPYIPSYYMVEAIKESLLLHPDIPFILLTCFLLLACSLPLFIIANYRFQKEL